MKQERTWCKPPRESVTSFAKRETAPAETAGLNTKKHKSPILQQRKRVLHPQTEQKKNATPPTKHCGYCRRRGHLETECHKKAKAKAALAVELQAEAEAYHAACREEDGGQAIVNLFVVGENKCYGVIAPEPRCEAKMERFYADSGANRHLHTDASTATKFTPRVISVNTAEGKRALKADGIGDMELFTPSGEQMPGFKKVLFSKQAAEKLCSIPELCEAGLACVFDKNGMKTYMSADYDCKTKPFTTDGRDRKTGLYYLTLQKEVVKTTSSAKAMSTTQSAPYPKPLASVPESTKSTGRPFAQTGSGLVEEEKKAIPLPEFIN